MRRLCGLIESFGAPADISRFESGETFLRDFAPGQFQIVFLDIYMEGVTGVETARKLRETDGRCVIIFTTTSKEHTFESYGVGAIEYILKPAAPEKVHAALHKALKLLAPAVEPSLTVMTGKKNRDIPHSQILYIEVYNKTSLVHTTDETIETYMLIEDMEKLLPSPPFLRCHRAYIVNLNYVADIGTDFRMNNGDTVYIRQRDYRKVRSAYMRHLITNIRGGGDV